MIISTIILIMGIVYTIYKKKNKALNDLYKKLVAVGIFETIADTPDLK